jgi:hypothetical protein
VAVLLGHRGDVGIQHAAADPAEFAALTAVLTLSERNQEVLPDPDRAAVIARIDGLAAVASTRAAEMTDDERRQLADAVAPLDAVASRSED